MTIKLFDTAQRGGRPVRGRPRRPHVRVRHHALRLDPPRSRRHLPHLRPPHPPARGARPRGAHGAQRHRRRRLDPPQGPRARRALPRAGGGRAGALPLRHGGARHPPAARRAPRHRVDRRHDRDGQRASSTTATPTSPTAPSTSTCRRSRATARCRTTPATRWCASPATRGGNPDDPHRRDPLDFVLWQPSLPDEPVVAGAVRRRPPGLARRVLGDGDARARPHHRPARRRHRPHLPAPRVRGRAERERHRPDLLAPLGALGDGELRGREDVEVARQPRVRERPPEDGRSARHPPRAHAPPLPGRLRVARHRPRRGHRAAAPPARRGRAPDGADPRPFAERVRAAIDARPRRAAGARGARRPRQRDPLRRQRPHRARRCSASSAPSSASTSPGPRSPHAA